jgi:hypothetical protein
VIAVAASTIQGSLASYSDFGPGIALSAPGGTGGHNDMIYVLWNAGTTTPEADAIGLGAGTSFAAPMVSGVASLVLGLAPDTTAAQLRGLLTSTATPFPAGSACATIGCGSGIVNAYGAVVAAGGVAVPSYQGTWWNAPAFSESGWGINFAHQGDTIFATWFTFDPNGAPLLLTMTATMTTPGVYSGNLLRAVGARFDAFDPTKVVLIPSGTATLSFADDNHATFHYRVTGVAPTDVEQTKSITRQAFGPLPTCTYSAQPGFTQATNYQDTWWNAPAGSESGWGINFAHEGDTIFATWFTFDTNGAPLLLSMTATRTAPGVYAGNLLRAVGARFDAFDPAKVVLIPSGTATLTFADGNHAQFHYKVTGVAPTDVEQTKSITRQLFAPPAGTVCH